MTLRCDAGSTEALPIPRQVKPTSALSRRDGELPEAGERASAAGDERDVQLVVEIPASQQRRRPRKKSGACQGATDKLSTGDPTACTHVATPVRKRGDPSTGPNVWDRRPVTSF